MLGETKAIDYRNVMPVIQQSIQKEHVNQTNYHQTILIGNQSKSVFMYLGLIINSGLNFKS